MINQTMTGLLRWIRFAAAIGLILVGALNSEAVLTLRAQTLRQSPASSESGGQKEGIKVHGHWTIEVRNPDGKVATHSEFENALTSGGAEMLGSFLGRTAVPGMWFIQLYDDSASRVPPTFGWLTTIGEAADHNAISKDLTVDYSTTLFTRNYLKVALNGTATLDHPATISTVWTYLSKCPGTVSPSTCAQTQWSSAFAFTSVTLPAPPCNPNTPCAVQVVAGQLIQVTVVFTFS